MRFLLASETFPAWPELQTLIVLAGELDLLGRLWDTTSLRDLNTGSGLLPLLVVLLVDIFLTIVLL